MRYRLLYFFSFLFYFSGKTQIIATIAGSGVSGWAGDGGLAKLAKISAPRSTISDKQGNLFIVDAGNNRIRKVDNAGIITTVAGNAVGGFSGDGGPAVNAEIHDPNFLALDNLGNLFILDATNKRVRKINAAGIITTYAGNGTQIYPGDGLPATSVGFMSPFGICIDKNRNMYVSDAGNNVIRKIDTSGIITTIAGSGASGFSGDTGPAILAQLNNPYGLAIDTLGAIYLADAGNNRIRKIDTSGIINTIAGNGLTGYAGDGGPATSAVFSIYGLWGLAVDFAGHVFTTDYNNHRVRMIDTNGIINTVAGTGVGGYSGDGWYANQAKLNVLGVSVDQYGDFYISEYYDHRIRKVSYCRTPISPFITGTTNICGGTSTNLTINGASTYTWSANSGGGNSQSVTISPATSTNYSVLVTGNGCVDSANVTVVVNPVITFTGPSSVCAGNSLTLTANGATTYTWSANAGSATTSTVILTPTTTIVYTVTGTSGGCISSKIIQITVNPDLILVPSATTICPGTSVLLTGSGATSYTWSANAGSVNTDTVRVSPVVSTDYTLSASRAGTTFSINGNAYICSGQSTVLSGPSCCSYSYTWAPGNLHTYSVSVAPSTTTIYTLTSVLTGYCPHSDTITVHVIPNPVSVISGDSLICFGDSTVLTALGTTTYTWSSNLNNANTKTVTVKPATTTVYSVSGTVGTCMSYVGTVTVTVLNSLALIGPYTMCLGDSAFLLASGCTSYSWTPVLSTSPVVKISPTIATIYTVTGTTGTCINSDTIKVQVINCSNSVCNNLGFESGSFSDWAGQIGFNWSSSQPLTITGYGIYPANFNSDGYHNIAGAGTDIYGGFNTLAPGNGIYSAMLGGPNINVGNGGETIEQGFRVDSTNYLFTYKTAIVLQDGLHPYGEQAYFKAEIIDANNNIIPSLSYSIQITASVTPTGFQQSIYDSYSKYQPWKNTVLNLSTYIGQNLKIKFTAAGCDQGAHFGYAYVDILCGNQVFYPTNYLLCTGANVLLTAMEGYNLYNWSGPGIISLATAQSVLVNMPGTYTVVSTDIGGTNDTNIVLVTQFNPTVTVTGNDTICAGTSTTLYAGGASTYVWSSNTGNAITDSVVVSPTVFTSYNVTGTDTNGCNNIGTYDVYVYTMPPVSIIAGADSICAGDSTLLTVSGANTYTWSANAGSVNTASVFVSPNVTTTYSVLGTDNNGCVNNTAQVINVTCTVGVNTFFGAEDVFIYPNPASNVLTIQSSGKRVPVIIYDALGVIVSQLNIYSKKTDIDITKLPAGVYTVSIAGRYYQIMKE